MPSLDIVAVNAAYLSMRWTFRVGKVIGFACANQLRSEMTARDRQAIADEQLSALQARLGALHTAKLLTDEQLFVAEDLCADFVELQAAVPEGEVLTKDAIYSAVGHSCAPAVKLHKIALLSDKMAPDAAFARQLRRKFL